MPPLPPVADLRAVLARSRSRAVRGLHGRLSQRPVLFRAVRRGKVLSRAVLRRAHEPEFAVFARLGRPDGVFLDIGGNSGQSAMSFRLYDRDRPIVSVEPNPALEGDLRLARRFVRNHRYLMCAAGPENGTTTLYVPFRERVMVSGEASLQRDHAGSLLGADTSWVEAVQVPVRRLDDLGLAPSHIKIDVEAEPIGVLEGLRETIEAHRPVILLEVGPGDVPSAVFLQERGDTRHVVVDGALRPARPGWANSLFLPGDAPRD